LLLGIQLLLWSLLEVLVVSLVAVLLLEEALLLLQQHTCPRCCHVRVRRMCGPQQQQARCHRPPFFLNTMRSAGLTCALLNLAMPRLLLVVLLLLLLLLLLLTPTPKLHTSKPLTCILLMFVMGVILEWPVSLPSLLPVCALLLPCVRDGPVPLAPFLFGALPASNTDGRAFPAAAATWPYV